MFQARTTARSRPHSAATCIDHSLCLGWFSICCGENHEPQRRRLFYVWVDVCVDHTLWAAGSSCAGASCLQKQTIHIGRGREDQVELPWEISGGFRVRVSDGRHVRAAGFRACGSWGALTLKFHVLAKSLQSTYWFHLDRVPQHGHCQLPGRSHAKPQVDECRDSSDSLVERCGVQIRGRIKTPHPLLVHICGTLCHHNFPPFPVASTLRCI